MFIRELSILRSNISFNFVLTALILYMSSESSLATISSSATKIFDATIKSSSSLSNTSKRGRPNFFIGYRLTYPPFINCIEGIQQSISITHPHLIKCFTSPNKLHITGFVMELTEAEDINRACMCLESCKLKIDELLSVIGGERSLNIPFGKIASFSTNVLYMDPLPSPQLDILRTIQSIIYETFYSNDPSFNVEIEKTTWIPHATIMKTSADKKNGRRLKILKSDFIVRENRVNNITVPLISIDLLSMTEKDESGYYKPYFTIPFIVRESVERVTGSEYQLDK